MEIFEDDAWERVRSARHGVFGTLHPERGVDLVPVVYAVTADRKVFLPVDTVKTKRTTRLRRLANIELDDRCTLVVENYDDEWSKLWWVRIHGTAEYIDGTDLDQFRPLLAAKYRQYESAGSVVGGLCLDPSEVTGWAAS